MTDHPVSGRRPSLPLILIASMTIGAAVAGTDDYTPHVDEQFPRTVLWGDTHVHSRLSLDANMSGNVSLSPADAFRFARGETVVANNGRPVKLRRPLDFLLVSDHAEYLGVMAGLKEKDALLLENETARRWEAALSAGDNSPFGEFARSLMAGESVLVHPDFARSVWRSAIEAAEAANDPGRFTALIGYEWTSMPGGNNLHRVVVFRDGPERTGRVLPFSAFDSDDPTELWAFMARYEEQTGGRVLAIPHNSNLSGGLMFPGPDASLMDAAYARERALREPLVEVTQVKGDSETHPFLSPDDEFADYESWDRSNVSMAAPHEDAWFPNEYVRSALKLGLAAGAKTGMNPYRFGLIGSTDSHTALATADEDDYWGKFVRAHPAPGRWQTTIVASDRLPYIAYEWEMAASGYAAVWANANTREAIFDAMQRRETYATTGPRMTVRFFGGWTFTAADAYAPDLAKRGYEAGVPMGGTLPEMQNAASAYKPRFLVQAMRDPDGANLDRLQIVKGWLTPAGTLEERVYDVAWSDDRIRTENGKLPPVTSTVNVDTATYSNEFGAAELSASWLDTDFDPEQAAFYYVRVLEVPTPRWTTYDAVRFGEKLPEEIPRITQERAYTSPIWYEPH
jgi:hypothetical protein